MTDKEDSSEKLSKWWIISTVLVIVAAFAVLIWLAVRAYSYAPPIPDKVTSLTGDTVFTRDDIVAGQQVFLKYGLMENGSVWGHGAYLGPDFSAEYLHTLAVHTGDAISRQAYNRTFKELTSAEQTAVEAQVRELLRQNRYDAKTGILTFTQSEIASYRDQISKWTAYFSSPLLNRGLRANNIKDPKDLSQLTAFFAWTAWVSVADRPGKSYSYTNNFPYDPTVGNTPTSDALLWSALSLIALLGGTAAVLFIFGKFNFLGWKGSGEHIHPQLIPGVTADSQRATIKYFVLAALLFLAQTLVGGATAHFRADPASFYGFDLSAVLPSNLLRTWHLQLAILWISTSYIAGGLFMASILGKEEPKGQVAAINFLFVALAVVVFGSLFGEMLGIFQLLGDLWFWFGDQGWEYLDLGRGWQILLVIGLFFWFFLMLRAVGRGRKDPEQREITLLFHSVTLAIPLFYLPALFYGSTNNFTVVDNWRFWIIHLWVEAFFELFVTVTVASLFFKLGMVSQRTAARVIYMDAILFLGSGIIGTAHHWYWTGQTNVTLALAAIFSALEIVPLTLLTLDAWDFIKLTQTKCDICGKAVSVPHKWTFYFMVTVGFWNFVGAGIFGFLINLPIISYFEVGTILTPNHGHAALMGVFGMLGISFMVFAIRQVLPEERWMHVEKYIRVSFWGLNGGLALMILFNLFPGGVLQVLDVLNNGYWHARSAEFLNEKTMRTIEWLRMPADLIFIVFGVFPIFIALGRTYIFLKK